jgi:predicted O-methyltransferase YrrM
MTLEDALTAIAERYALDAAQLIAYADEDTHTGWDHGSGAWMVGSLFRQEGQILYALVRALRPVHVVELGTHVGCSATHMAQALAANEHGTLHAVDVWEGAGAQIPNDLRPRIQQHFTDGAAWLRDTDIAPDMVYEDALHGIDMTRDMWQAGLSKVRAGGFIISHDAAHWLVGAEVRGGIEAAGIHDYFVVCPDGCECGLAIYQVQA